MKLRKFVAFLFLVHGTSFYFVRGQTATNEKTDCTKYYNYLYEDDKDYNNTCCITDGYEYIKCDYENYITRIENNIYLGGKINPNMKSFPSFPKLEELHIIDHGIKEMPYGIFNSTYLRILKLPYNDIKVVPPDIQNLTYLEKLDLSYNDIMELPNELFNLPNLNSINIGNNPYLNVKFIKFSNSPIHECTFDNIKISCYERHACNLINYDNTFFYDDTAEKHFTICTEEQKKEVLNQISQNNGSNSKNGSNGNNGNNENKDKDSDPPYIFIIKVGVIVGCVSVVLLNAYLLYKKRKIKSSKKRNINNILNSNINQQ